MLFPYDFYKIIHDHLPANTRRWSSVGSLLSQRRRLWSNIDPTLGQRIMFIELKEHIIICMKTTKPEKIPLSLKAMLVNCTATIEMIVQHQHKSDVSCLLC